MAPDAHSTKNGGNATNGRVEPEDTYPKSGSPGPPVPPDGGYGWVVLFASFMCNFIVDGVCFSFGIFYLEFLNHFNGSKARTSWVGSILNGVYLSMGPVTAALANKYGCRAVTMVGSVVATSAFILSTYSPTLNILTFTYGGLVGFGFGLMYLPAIVMVGFYFEKKRAFATGIAVCGSGIGAFAFAPLCERLLTIYDWRGAIWIIAGITLNGVVMGALFRPLEPHKSQTINCEAESPLVEKTENSNFDKCQGKPLENKHLLINDDKSIQSMHNLAPISGVSQEKRGCHVLVSRSLDDLSRANTQEIRNRQYKDLQRPLYRKDIFYSGSIHHLPEYKSSEQTYVRSVTNIPEDVCDDVTGKTNSCSRWAKSMVDTLRNMVDFSLLKHPVFCLYGISCILCMTGFFVPFIYLPDNAVNQGYSSEKAAFLVSIIGIANTIARVATGWVSDQPWSNCLIINNSALIIGGVASILCPFCFNYGLLATYSFVFGMCIAAFVSLRSIIMVELLGLEKLTNSFGLVTMCQGLSAFIGAPIAGALYDITGTYNMSFYVAGATMVVAGLICIPLRRVAAWCDKRENSKLQRETFVVLSTEGANGAAV